PLARAPLLQEPRAGIGGEYGGLLCGHGLGAEDDDGHADNESKVHALRLPRRLGFAEYDRAGRFRRRGRGWRINDALRCAVRATSASTTAAGSVAPITENSRPASIKAQNREVDR